MARELLTNSESYEKMAKAVETAFRNHPALSTTLQYNENGDIIQKYNPKMPIVITPERISEEELNKIKNIPLTKRQLSLAKKQFIGQFAISSENNEAYMLGVGKSYLVFGSVDSLDEVYRKIEQITPQDIMDVARDIFGSLSSLTYK